MKGPFGVVLLVLCAICLCRGQVGAAVVLLLFGAVLASFLKAP